MAPAPRPRSQNRPTTGWLRWRSYARAAPARHCSRSTSHRSAEAVVASRPHRYRTLIRAPPYASKARWHRASAFACNCRWMAGPSASCRSAAAGCAAAFSETDAVAGCVPFESGRFVVASTDMGHQGNGGTFGANPQQRADFAHRGVHLTARAAKALIKTFYDRGPAYSYFRMLGRRARSPDRGATLSGRLRRHRRRRAGNEFPGAELAAARLAARVNRARMVAACWSPHSCRFCIEPCLNSVTA